MYFVTVSFFVQSYTNKSEVDVLYSNWILWGIYVRYCLLVHPAAAVMFITVKYTLILNKITTLTN